MKRRQYFSANCIKQTLRKRVTCSLGQGLNKWKMVVQRKARSSSITKLHKKILNFC